MNRVFDFLIAYLENVFKKNIRSISSSEFATVKNIPINGFNFNENSIDLEDIVSLFPNLESIDFENYNFSQKDIEILANHKLKRISFNRCGFSNQECLSKLDLNTLILNKCKIQSFGFLENGYQNLKGLLIKGTVSLQEFDCNFVRNKNMLKQLTLENLKVDNFDVIKDNDKLEVVSILNSSVKEAQIESLTMLPNLNLLFINEDLANSEYLTNLEDNVSVKFNYFDKMVMENTSVRKL